MNIKKDKHYKKIISEKDLSKSSQNGYYYALKMYSELHDMSPTELIKEADNEEEERIRMKHRTIKNRLIQYQQWLKKQEYSKKYITLNRNFILSFYNYFEIETPKLPPLNLKTIFHERFEDIPTLKHIKQAVESTNNFMYKAMILFMASSGSARIETYNLTINDFIEATTDYHNNGNLETILKELESQKDIVPLFKMVRQKTDYPYYTCCSPETTEMIIRHLKTLDNPKINDRLFNIRLESISRIFNRINIRNNWHRKNNGINFFHAHALRKFNASAIEDIGLANTLQGRKADSITEAYFKHNPKRIKEKYLEHLPKLTINKTVVNTVDTDASKELKKELAETKERLVKVEEEKANMADEIYERIMKDIKDLPP